jgi:predicted enzyme related to lactoylglutathione lyase
MAEFESYSPGTPCWVDLGTTDPEAARAFYAAVFGWDYDVGPPEAGEYTVATVRGKPVAGLYAYGPEMEGTPPTWTMYLATDDAAGCARRMEQAGGTVLAGPMQVMEEGAMAVVRDPSGAVVGLWQAGRHIGARVANEPGGFIWNELLTRDLQAARGFYVDVFGYDTDEMDVGAPTPYVVLKLADREIAGMMTTPPHVPEQAPSHWLTYFAVSDTDAAVADVEKAGGQVMNGPNDSPYGRLAVVADPQGAVFTVIQSTPEGASEGG